MTFQVAGKATQAPLYETLPARRIGALAASPVALAPLFFAQEIAGLRGRVSRILVAPAPGAESRVRAALEALAAGRLNVESIGYDEELFATAATASNQSTALFSAISALVGFLFAFNATLLTVPQRRQLIADLRRDGYTPRTVIAVLLVDGLVLGLIACALGLALGEELSVHLLRSEPAFFSLAFTVGSQRVVSAQSVAIAVGGGMLAAIVAVLSPLRDILSRDPLAAITPRGGRREPGQTRRRVWCSGHVEASGRVPECARRSRGSPAWPPRRRCCSPRPTPRSQAWSCWSRPCCWSCRSRSRRCSRSSARSRARS